MQSQKQSSSDQEQIQEMPSTQQQAYIIDAQEFLDICKKDKKIKVMDQCNPIWNNVYVKDVSLHKKGPIEDKIYSRNDKYYKNIRRGNTLCQIYYQTQPENSTHTYDLFFCRRGMKKFYDLQPYYLLLSANLSTHHKLIKNRIFEELESELNQPNNKYHLYRLFKENGQHCQIGYVKQLNCWLFASKNVTVLARNPQDLQKNYHKERFYWAKLVGEEFFRVLQTLNQQKQEEFKKDIDGFTLLGEHCGHEKHQHITKYQKVQIIFYGLVKNVGKDHCQPVQQCRMFLSKYNLKMSSCVEKKGLTDKNTIYACMHDMLKEVAEGTMEKQGQGSVMYIVCQRDGQQRTVSMCKLKTCEYLVYRRLRQMLKLNVSRKSTANTFQKFKHDIEQIITHYFKPPKPLQFYFKLGQKAFQQAEKNSQISQTYLRYKFVDFIAQFEQEQKLKSNIKLVTAQPKRIILICLPRVATIVQKYCKSKDIEVDYMYRPGKPAPKSILHMLYMIPRLGQKLQENVELIIAQYNEADILNSIQQLQTCKDITKSHLITFVKSSDKAKSIRMLYSKIEAFRQSCLKQNISFSLIDPSEQSIIGSIRKSIESQHINNEHVLNKKTQFTKYIVIPLLIPGSGKSSFAQQLLKSHNVDWKIIDTDKIRRNLMQNIEEVDLDSSQQTQQLFIQAKNETLLQFKKLLADQIESSSNKNAYLYIDKLYSPYNINEAIEEILKLSNQSIKIIIVTQVYSPVKLNDFTYPFSTNYLFTCLRRCLERQDHKTMQNNPYEVAKIVLRYYQMNANYNEKNILKLSPDKIQIIKFAFIEDDQSCHYVHQNLKKKLQQCLKLIEPGKLAKDGNCFIELVEQLYKYIQIKEENSFKKYHQFRLDLQQYINSLK